MVAYGHKKGVTMGWYDNNCMCMDEYTKRNDPIWEAASNGGDVKFLLENDFDAVKIDNCGDDQGVDFNQRVDLINASGKALMIENSNQGFGNPQRGACKGSMQCPGCNNSAVPHGCGRGNPNNTLAPGWCKYNMFRTCGDIGPDFGEPNAELPAVERCRLKAIGTRSACWPQGA